MASRRWLFPIGAVVGALLYRAWRQGGPKRWEANFRLFCAPTAELYDRVAGTLSEPLYRLASRGVLERISTGSVLDVGSGPGRLAVLLAKMAPELEVTGLDIEPDMIDVARRRALNAGLAGRVHFELGDVAAMPFRDAQFDMAVSTFSMHHWEQAERGLAEIRRVLKPGAQVCIYDISENIIRLMHHGTPLSASEMGRLFGGEYSERVWSLGPIPAMRRVCLRREEAAVEGAAAAEAARQPAVPSEQKPAPKPAPRRRRAPVREQPGREKAAGEQPAEPRKPRAPRTPRRKAPPEQE